MHAFFKTPRARKGFGDFLVFFAESVLHKRAREPRARAANCRAISGCKRAHNVRTNFAPLFQKHPGPQAVFYKLFPVRREKGNVNVTFRDEKCKKPPKNQVSRLARTSLPSGDSVLQVAAPGLRLRVCEVHKPRACRPDPPTPFGAVGLSYPYPPQPPPPHFVLAQKVWFFALFERKMWGMGGRCFVVLNISF